MTQDEIIRMAREAGFNVHPRKNTISSKECLCDETLNELLERFYQMAFAAGVAHEREACAKVCEEKRIQMNYSEAPYNQCAAAIRARGESHGSDE